MISAPAAEERLTLGAAGAGFVRRLLRRPLPVAALLLLAIVIVGSFGAPILAPDNPLATDFQNVLQVPSRSHLLGTDQLGRDVLSRLMYGGRVTLVATAEGTAVALLVGVVAGLVAGFIGGVVDAVVGRAGDVTMAFPAIVILLVVLSVFPQNLTAAMVAFGILLSPGPMRVVRASTLAVRQELYIDAARVSGISRFRIIANHVLPRITGAVIVQGALVAAVTLIVGAGLAFLGLGVAPPQPSWGSMIQEAASVIQQEGWLLIPPGGIIALTVLALGLLGDGVRDAVSEGWSGPEGTSRPTTKARALESPAPAEQDDGGVRLSAPDVFLSVRDLSVAFDGHPEPFTVVDRVTFEMRSGEAVGLLGESGCGKTVTARSILGLPPRGSHIIGGRITFEGTDLTALTGQELARVRGKRIAMISQEPMASLDPMFRVEALIRESVRLHEGLSGRAARARVVELLSLVRLPDPERVARRYPHQLSGGMAQRVALARALAGSPQLLIADEPTTALDVTVEAEVLDLLRSLQLETGMAILLVTHDWDVVADVCSRALVMYAGQIVEQAEVDELFRAPAHPYTKGLLASNPRLATHRATLPAIPGTVPRPQEWAGGCHFQPRCAYATAGCAIRPIPLHALRNGRETRCIHFDRLVGEG